MALPTAPGFPQLSGNYIPEIWSAKILIKFYEATVLAEIANTDYEGEISGQGDKVNIRTTPTITVRDYRKGQKLVDETPESAPVELLIDRGKYWSFVVDDVDEHQADIPFPEDWQRDASDQNKIVIDTEVLGEIPADADAANRGTTAGKISGDIDLGTAGAPLFLTKSNILDVLIDIGTVFDEQNVPESDRGAVMPPWATALIKKSDLKDASLAGDGTSIVRNGRVGMIDRLMIYNSNLLATAIDAGAPGTPRTWDIIGIQKSALTFASDLVRNERIRSESTFGWKYRGLQVYGFEVIKPEALVHVYAAKG